MLYIVWHTAIWSSDGLQTLKFLGMQWSISSWTSLKGIFYRRVSTDDFCSWASAASTDDYCEPEEAEGRNCFLESEICNLWDVMGDDPWYCDQNVGRQKKTKLDFVGWLCGDDGKGLPGRRLFKKTFFMLKKWSLEKDKKGNSPTRTSSKLATQICFELKE